jgi:hypothetical protein
MRNTPGAVMPLHEQRPEQFRSSLIIASTGLVIDAFRSGMNEPVELLAVGERDYVNPA